MSSSSPKSRWVSRMGSVMRRTSYSISRPSSISSGRDADNASLSGSTKDREASTLSSPPPPPIVSSSTGHIPFPVFDSNAGNSGAITDMVDEPDIAGHFYAIAPGEVSSPLLPAMSGSGPKSRWSARMGSVMRRTSFSISRPSSVSSEKDTDNASLSSSTKDLEASPPSVKESSSLSTAMGRSSRKPWRSARMARMMRRPSSVFSVSRRSSISSGKDIDNTSLSGSTKDREAPVEESSFLSPTMSRSSRKPRWSARIGSAMRRTSSVFSISRRSSVSVMRRTSFSISRPSSISSEKDIDKATLSRSLKDRETFTLSPLPLHADISPTGYIPPLVINTTAGNPGAFADKVDGLPRLIIARDPYAVAPVEETQSPTEYISPPLVDSTAGNPGAFTDKVNGLPQPVIIRDPYAVASEEMRYPTENISQIDSTQPGVAHDPQAPVPVEEIQSEICLRERRSTLPSTLFTLGAWVVYVSVWYCDSLPAMKTISNPGVAKGVKMLPVLFGPVFVLFIRRIVQFWYGRKGDTEGSLATLFRSKPSPTPLFELPPPLFWNNLNTKMRAFKPGQYSSITLIPPRQHDQFADFNLDYEVLQEAAAKQESQDIEHLKPSSTARVEEDEEEELPPPYETIRQTQTDKAALICLKCFAHNGLVKESMWEDIQFVCPKCNHFNVSPRSRTRQQITSSSASASSSRQQFFSQQNPSAGGTVTNHDFNENYCLQSTSGPLRSDQFEEPVQVSFPPNRLPIVQADIPEIPPDPLCHEIPLYPLAYFEHIPDVAPNPVVHDIDLFSVEHLAGGIPDVTEVEADINLELHAVNRQDSSSD